MGYTLDTIDYTLEASDCQDPPNCDKQEPIDDKQQYGNSVYDSNIHHPGAEYDDDLGVQCPSHTSQRRLVSKIDLRVIPVLSILYLLAFLDRTNIANASVFGLQKDCKICFLLTYFLIRTCP